MSPEEYEGLHEVYAAADSCGEGDLWTERVQILQKCVTGLPEKFRTACKEFYYRGLSAREIASKCATTQDAIFKRLERVRTMLRACMERKLGLESSHDR